jgi:hypothetical protein
VRCAMVAGYFLGFELGLGSRTYEIVSLDNE